MKKLIPFFFLMVLVPIVISAQGNGFNFHGRRNDATSPANGSSTRFDIYVF